MLMVASGPITINGEPLTNSILALNCSSASDTESDNIVTLYENPISPSDSVITSLKDR